MQTPSLGTAHDLDLGEPAAPAHRPNAASLRAWLARKPPIVMGAVLALVLGLAGALVTPQAPESTVGRCVPSQR